MSRQHDEQMNRVYVGQRTATGAAEVWADGKPFVAQLNWRAHFPDTTGFEWGYRGRGPSMLALALLLDATDGNLRIAFALYIRFMHDVVSVFHPHGFATNRLNVLRWICEQDRSYDPFSAARNGTEDETAV